MDILGYSIQNVQVGLGYAFGLGLGVGCLLSVIRFLLFDSVERGQY